MSKYIIVDESGNIVNRIVWDGEPSWEPQAGQSVIEDQNNEYDIGGTYIEGVYTPPPAPEE